MGFDCAKFVTSVADDKKCILCHGVLDNPLRSSCGHVFCSSCILPWVDTYGDCPQKCRTLATSDLENVLSLREVILNLKVKCEFFEHGCLETYRLTDVYLHNERCGFQPVSCNNPGCNLVLPVKDIYLHETESCLCRPVGQCGKGCGLVLYLSTMSDHDCYESLKSLMKSQEKMLRGLEQQLTALRSKFTEREAILLGQVTILHQQLGDQANQFNKALNDLKCQQIVAGSQDKELEMHRRSLETIGSVPWRESYDRRHPFSERLHFSFMPRPRDQSLLKCPKIFPIVPPGKKLQRPP